MTTARYRSLLRSVYTSVLASRLTAGELRALSDELRRGRLADELAYMLSQAAGHFSGPDGEGADDDRLAEVEQLVRSNRVSKSTLSNILESLGFTASGIKDSNRYILRRFISEAPPARVSKLFDILQSIQSEDSFLTGIRENRK